jgi:hypothetical protein
LIIATIAMKIAAWNSTFSVKVRRPTLIVLGASIAGVD